MSEFTHVIHVTLENFATEVIEKSKQVPVLVDFSAEWCAPCRMLEPILEKLASESQGTFVIAKVDSDEEQKLTGQYGVRGFPTLKLFRHGEVVDEAYGVQPASKLKKMLSKQ